MMDLGGIRDESLAQAERLGVWVLPGLPVLDEVMEMRGSEEAASRLLAMGPVAASSYGFDRARAIAWLKQEGLFGFLTDRENRFLIDGVGDPEPFREQVEGMWALAWALGIVSELEFDKQCDDNFVEVFPTSDQSSAGFRAKVKPRPLEEVIAALDLAYCLHWAVRDAMIRGKPIPGNLDPVVVIERRRALEWLVSKDEWDEVTLDT